mmetsp:Transcript_3889/g.8826  ORF Transcript_3889/g.8826 Transcript_3889/m.8826 type:complete len:205 (-) Transcript_3889:661-1275(-)
MVRARSTLPVSLKVTTQRPLGWSSRVQFTILTCSTSPHREKKRSATLSLAFQGKPLTNTLRSSLLVGANKTAVSLRATFTKSIPDEYHAKNSSNEILPSLSMSSRSWIAATCSEFIVIPADTTTLASSVESIFPSASTSTIWNRLRASSLLTVGISGGLPSGLDISASSPPSSHHCHRSSAETKPFLSVSMLQSTLVALATLHC